MSRFSVLRPSLFLLGLFFFSLFFGLAPELRAWNPDYAYDLPKQRRMCVRREKDDTVFFYSILSDEECPPTEARYLVIFAREPRGAMALLETNTSQKFYPPLTLKWPPDEKISQSRLWHFTCVKLGEKEILGSKVQLYRYMGEMTSDVRQDCLEAEERALQYCQKEYKGEELLEQCPITWGR
jgi:hypothetical protein